MSDERDIEIALCVFREANDALIVFDPRDRRVADVNPTALRLTGLGRKEAIGRKIDDLLQSRDSNDLRRLLAACQTTGFFQSQEGFALARPGASPIPVSVGISRIHTRPEPLGLAIIRDVSARKKVEAELREARDSLESRVLERTRELDEAVEAMRLEILERKRVEAELRRAQEAAESAGRAKDRFLAVLSHELRTPLTPVLAMVSAVLDGPNAPPEFRPTFEMIRRSISLEARLIDDLLDATRAGRGKLRLEFEPVDALEMIGQAIEICRHEAHEARVRVVVEPGASNHRIEADPTRFQQVIWNLVLNAVKSSEPGGSIVVSTVDLDGGRLGLSVDDDGRGIEPELLTRIFEPFEQGRTALLRRPGGLGLGLSICRSIVEGHGGRLTASSEGPGRGATFAFDMPPARDSASKPVPPSMFGSSPPPLEGASTLGAEILLVEDNKDVLRYLKLVLEMKGHRVRTSIDLASARGQLEPPFDLLISDIELPDGSGLDLMRELRGRVPGIAISGFGAPDDVQMSLDAGFARHLVKPVETRRLDEAIALVIAEGGDRPGGFTR